MSKCPFPFYSLGYWRALIQRLVQINLVTFVFIATNLTPPLQGESGGIGWEAIHLARCTRITTIYILLGSCCFIGKPWVGEALPRRWPFFCIWFEKSSDELDALIGHVCTFQWLDTEVCGHDLAQHKLSVTRLDRVRRCAAQRNEQDRGEGPDIASITVATSLLTSNQRVRSWDIDGTK